MRRLHETSFVFLDNIRSDGESGDPFSDVGALVDHVPAVKKSVRIEVGRRQGEPELRPTKRGTVHSWKRAFLRQVSRSCWTPR